MTLSSGRRWAKAGRCAKHPRIGPCSLAAADRVARAFDGPVAPPAGAGVFWGRKRTRQPTDGIRPRSPEQEARVTAPFPWRFAAPPRTQAVWASRTAFCGWFASAVVEDEALKSSGPTVALRASVRRHRSHLERSSRHCMTRIGLRPLLYVCHHRPVNAYPISLDISHPEWDRPGRPGTRRGPAPARGTRGDSWPHFPSRVALFGGTARRPATACRVVAPMIESSLPEVTIFA